MFIFDHNTVDKFLKLIDSACDSPYSQSCKICCRYFENWNARKLWRWYILESI